jgi:hypothetical protein
MGLMAPSIIFGIPPSIRFTSWLSFMEIPPMMGILPTI